MKSLWCLFWGIICIAVFPGFSFAKDARMSAELSGQQVEEQIRKLPEPEADELGRELAKALKFYYDQDYAAALPVFQKISGKISSPDLMFWIGSCAGRMGNCDLAENELQKILEIQPNHMRASLELGIAFSQCRQPEKAKAEFEKVMATSPPPEVKSIIHRYLGRSGSDRKIFTWKLRFAQAYRYDSNISSGPGKDMIEDSGSTIIMDEKSKEQGSSNWISDLRSSFIYDFGASDGFLWNGGLDVYYSHSFEDSDFDYLNAEVRTGPWWRGEKDIVKIPFGYSYKNYARDSLSNTFFVHPETEHFFCKYFSIKGAYRFSAEKYAEDRYTDAGYDNDTHKFSAGPNFYLKNRKIILSGLYSYEDSEADSDHLSHDAHHLSASVYTVLPSDTEFLLCYKWTDKNYDEPSALYPNKSREDTRHTAAAVVNQNFLKHYFLSGELAWIRNESNEELYDYDKTVFTVSAGLKY